MRYANLIYWLAAIFLSSTLGGCGSDTGTATTAAGPATIQGKVMSDKGPVTEGVVKAVDSQGRTLTNLRLTGDSNFRIQIPSDASYPVVLSATFGNGETLEAVVTSSVATEQDITPYSDLVVKSARSQGGLTLENIARAARGAIGQRGQRIAGFAAETAPPPATRIKRSSGGDHGH